MLLGRLRTTRRGPTVASIAVAVLLLLTALFARGGVDHAAAAVLRARVDEVFARAPERPIARADLERFVGANPDVRSAAAGDLRVVSDRPSTRRTQTEARDGLEIEIEPPERVRDLHFLGLFVCAIAALGGAATIALGLSLTRALRHEDALRAQKEHDERLADLGRMSAVLAHELKNPLASMKGNAQLLLEDLPANAKVERVVEGAVRLERRLNDLLEFARTGELRLRTAPVGEVVRGAVRGVEPAPVALDVAPDVGDARIDPDRLRLALENVVRNAIDASPEVLVKARRDGRAIVVTVRDHGPGVARGDEEAIFEPFFTKKDRGTGLGLAVARRIVNLHGGQIAVSNHPEGGALFRVTLPAGD
jgi:two-component system sensor histidine kinase HydH